MIAVVVAGVLVMLGLAATAVARGRNSRYG